jgi:response regulator of citrate/malate metabolism
MGRRVVDDFLLRGAAFVPPAPLITTGDLEFMVKIFHHECLSSAVNKKSTHRSIMKTTTHKQQIHIDSTIPAQLSSIALAAIYLTFSNLRNIITSITVHYTQCG